MPNQNFNDRLRDYVTVNERIDAFYAKHPNGSLQSEMIYKDDALVVFKAYAYRDADDPRPGIGHSSLAIPGTTPYTRGSEVENAETSSWGRALAALGFEVKRGVATRDEIDNKHDDNAGVRLNPYLKDGDKNVPLEKSVSVAQRAKLWNLVKTKFGDEVAAKAWLENKLEALDTTSKTMTPENLKLLTQWILEAEVVQPEPMEETDIEY
jgi:hypothetical protein